MGRDSERREDLIDRVYDAAFTEDGFASLAPLIGEFVNSDRAMTSLRTDGGRTIVDMSITDTPERAEDYLNHYSRIDPWTPAIVSLTPGHFAYGSELVDLDAVQNTEFFVDYALPLGVAGPMCGRLTLDAETDLMVAVSRAGLDDFTEADRTSIAEIASHLRRVVQIRRRLEAESLQNSLRAAALDAVAFGLGVVDETGRLIIANAALEEFARAGLGVKLSANRLTSFVHADADRLALMIRQAARDRRESACTLTAPNGLPRMAVIVSPARNHHAQVAVAPARTNPLAPSLTMQMFGFSPAESEIVSGLWAGLAPREIAAKRGVKATTLKTQLETIYRKAGAGDQRKLLRLLGSLPQLRLWKRER